MTHLYSARSRLAQLRNKLHAELSALKSSSAKHKKTEGRLGGVMDAIQILDEEMLAEEQGRAQQVTTTKPGLEREWERMVRNARPSLGLTFETSDHIESSIRPDQVAWLNARRGGK